MARINDGMQTGEYEITPKLGLSWELKIVEKKLFVVTKSGVLNAHEVIISEWSIPPQVMHALELNEGSAPPPAAKTQVTESQPRAEGDSKDGILLSDWFTMLRTWRGRPRPRDKALKFMDRKLRSGELRTEPKLPAPTKQDRMGWQLKLIGTDDTLYVVSRGGRIDARKIRVFDILLAPVPLAPEIMQALYPEDAVPVGTAPKPAAPSLPQPKQSKLEEHPTVAWVRAEIRRMQAAGQIPHKITHLAQALERRMLDAPADNKPPRPIKARSIENMLRDEGLWPVSRIE